MLVRSIINKINGTRWDIVKQGNGTYIAKYSELYAGDWRYLFEENGFTKEAIESEFDIVLA